MQILRFLLTIGVIYITPVHAQMDSATFHLKTKKLNIGSVNTVIHLVRDHLSPKKIRISYNSESSYRTCEYSGESDPYWVSGTCGYDSNLNYSCTDGHFTTSETCRRYSADIKIDVVKKATLDFTAARKLSKGESETLSLFISPSYNDDNFHFFGKDSVGYSTKKSFHSFIGLKVSLKFSSPSPVTKLSNTVIIRDNGWETELHPVLLVQKIGSHYDIYRCNRRGCPYFYMPMAAAEEFAQLIDPKYKVKSKLSEESLRESLIGAVSSFNGTPSSGPLAPLTKDEHSALKFQELSKLEIFELQKEKAELHDFVRKYGEDPSITKRLGEINIKLNRNQLRTESLKKVNRAIDDFFDSLASPELFVLEPSLMSQAFIFM